MTAPDQCATCSHTRHDHEPDQPGDDHGMASPCARASCGCGSQFLEMSWPTLMARLAHAAGDLAAAMITVRTAMTEAFRSTTALHAVMQQAGLLDDNSPQDSAPAGRHHRDRHDDTQPRNQPHGALAPAAPTALLADVLATPLAPATTFTPTLPPNLHAATCDKNCGGTCMIGITFSTATPHQWDTKSAAAPAPPTNPDLDDTQTIPSIDDTPPTDECDTPTHAEWACERCSAPRWVGWRNGPTHEGWPRKAQCVPCGHVQDLPADNRG